MCEHHKTAGRCGAVAEGKQKCRLFCVFLKATSCASGHSDATNRDSHHCFSSILLPDMLEDRGKKLSSIEFSQALYGELWVFQRVRCQKAIYGPQPPRVETVETILFFDVFCFGSESLSCLNCLSIL